MILGLSVLLFCLTLSTVDSQPELKRQSDAYQMFLLRDALRRYPRPSDFCAGEVSCAFNDTAKCVEKVKKVLANNGKPAAAEQIHH
jgi:hypothetical protein